MGSGRVCSHFRHEAGAREALGGVLMLVRRYFRGVAGGRWRPLAACGTFQLYCNGVQWVTFKFNLKF